MKVALTVWKNRISPVADSAHRLLVTHVGNRKIKARHYELFLEESPFNRAKRLSELGIEVFICGAISDFYAGLIEGYGIRVISFIRGEEEEVLHAYLKDSLTDPEFAMAGWSQMCLDLHNR